MIVRSSVCLFALTLATAVGCTPGDSKEAAESPAPAKVAKPANEDELATITLTVEAERRLGIRIPLAQVERKPVRRQRTLGGEVVFPPGQAITVSAPVSGALTAPSDGHIPSPGTAVTKGQPIFSLLPLLAPEHTVLTPADQVQMAESRAALATSRIDAGREVESAGLELDAAQIALDRAQQLVRDKAGSLQALDEARARFELARKTLDAARVRFDFLEGIRLESDAGMLVRQTIVAPVTGILSNFNAVDGETVVGGEVLFQVVDTQRMWIRVPVYVGQWREVDPNQDVTVREFGQSAQTPGRLARPIVAPPSANAIAATVDLFYEVTNDDGQLRPGHKVAVTLPLVGEEESLVIPWAAVLFDIHGGTWAYEKIAPQTYVRQRVDVEFVRGPDAVLARGPQPGTEVVTDGAAELFGTEFGFGK